MNCTSQRCSRVVHRGCILLGKWLMCSVESEASTSHGRGYQVAALFACATWRQLPLLHTSSDDSCFRSNCRFECSAACLALSDAPLQLLLTLYTWNPWCKVHAAGGLPGPSPRMQPTYVISHYTAALFRISSNLVDKKHVLCVCFFERYTDAHECLNNRRINFARNAFMIDAMIKSAE